MLLSALSASRLTHWENYTTETQEVAIELTMCVDAVEKLSRLWEHSDPEDRQGLAQSLFEFIAYDLETRRITDFRLKLWADRFLMLRASLYERDKRAERFQEEGTDMLPRGFQHISVPPLEEAVTSLLAVLYAPPNQPMTPHNTPKPERNVEIRARYAEGGWSIPGLACEYGISNARVHQILKRRSQDGEN